MPPRLGPWLRATGLAAITGGRTTLGPALLVCGTARRRWLRAAVTAAAVLELIGDKLPRVPDRTAPIGLAFRIACGAGVARAMLPDRGRVGARALGVAAAVLGAFAGLRLRLALTRRLGGGALANAIAGLLEDAALLVAGRRFAGARPAR